MTRLMAHRAPILAQRPSARLTALAVGALRRSWSRRSQRGASRLAVAAVRARLGGSCSSTREPRLTPAHRGRRCRHPLDHGVAVAGAASPSTPSTWTSTCSSRARVPLPELRELLRRKYATRPPDVVLAGQQPRAARRPPEPGRPVLGRPRRVRRRGPGRGRRPSPGRGRHGHVAPPGLDGDARSGAPPPARHAAGAGGHGLVSGRSGLAGRRPARQLAASAGPIEVRYRGGPGPRGPRQRGRSACPKHAGGRGRRRSCATRPGATSRRPRRPGGSPPPRACRSTGSPTTRSGPESSGARS